MDIKETTHTLGIAYTKLPSAEDAAAAAESVLVRKTSVDFVSGVTRIWSVACGKKERCRARCLEVAPSKFVAILPPSGGAGRDI
jgi:hypothetical protein